MQPGFYGSPKDIVDELMKGLRLYYGDKPLRVRLLYMYYANKFKIQLAGGKMNFAKDLRNMLGTYFPEYTSPAMYVPCKEIDIYQGTYSIFVYCDVVEPRIVGDIVTPLLTTVPVEDSHGDYIHKRFKKIHYHLLLRKNFTDIQISLRNDQGEKLKFERKKVRVTLRSRRRKLEQL